MMHRAVLVGAVLLALVVSPLHSAAQSAAQIKARMGTWKLSLAESKYEHGPAPKSETRTYTAWQGDGLSANFELITASGEKQTTTYSAKFGGKEYPYHGPTGDMVSLKADANDVTVATVKKAGKVAVTSRSSVSKDGKTSRRPQAIPTTPRPTSASTTSNRDE